MVKWKFGQTSKSLKYYDHHCLENFVLLFMSLLQIRIAKRTMIWLVFTLSFWKKSTLNQTWRAFNIKFVPQWKDSKSSYHVRQTLTHFSKVVDLTLVLNCVKSLTAPNIFKQVKLKGAWRVLEAKNCFQIQAWIKRLRQILVFMWIIALREKFKFYFPRAFC